MAERSEFYEHEKESFATFLCNTKKGTVMGRTGISWCKIVVFYLIFYSFLAAFFAGMMAMFYQTLDVNHKPKYTPGDGSSILRNPALGVRPRPRRYNMESSLIWYESRKPYDVKHWTHSLDEFIRPYEESNLYTEPQMTECRSDRIKTYDQVCIFKDTWLGSRCQKREGWGYQFERPCVILKLNKMIDWKPEVYKRLNELPYDMPEDLKTHITNVTLNKGGVMPEMIWVSCKGENPVDQEYIGDLDYQPWRGFPAYYFPYTNNPGYMSPIVAVEFINPKTSELVNIECRAWAKNIFFDRKNKLGLVHFELLID